MSWGIRVSDSSLTGARDCHFVVSVGRPSLLVVGAWMDGLVVLVSGAGVAVGVGSGLGWVASLWGWNVRPGVARFPVKLLPPCRWLSGGGCGFLQSLLSMIHDRGTYTL